MSSISENDNQIDNELMRVVVGSAVSHMNHEILLRLNSMIGHSQLLLEHKLELEEDHLNLFHENSKYVLNSYEEFISLFDFVNSPVNLSIEEIDLNQFVEQVMVDTKQHWLMKYRLPDVNVEELIEQSIPREVSKLWADRLLTQQAIVETIVRTAPYREKGKVLFGISSDDTWSTFTVSVNTTEDSPWTYDFGYDYIYSPKLFISRYVVEMHGGQMTSEWQESSCSIVTTIKLPVLRK